MVIEEERFVIKGTRNDKKTDTITENNCASSSFPIPKCKKASYSIAPPNKSNKTIRALSTSLVKNPTRVAKNKLVKK